MACLWTQTEPNEDWAIVPLEADHHELGEQRKSPSFNGNGKALDSPSVLVVRHWADNEEQWVLLSQIGADVRVNGQLLVLGIRALRDRDEILLGDNASGEWRRYYFSLERLAQMEPMRSARGPMVCPRCKQPIARDETAVQCPNPRCRAWHHQDNNLPCWTYSATCSLCDQPTALEAAYRWTPELL